MNEQCPEEFKREISSLKSILAQKEEQLQEAQEVIDAIRSGSVDGIVRSTEQGEQIFVLKGSDQPYRNLIEEMTEGAIIISHDNAILYCNNGFAKMINTQLEKLIGSSINDWISTADSDKFSELISDHKQNVSKRVSEITLQTKDKQQIPTQVSVNKLSMDSVCASGVIFVDLTKHMDDEVKRYTAKLEKEIFQRKKAEAELMLRTEELERLQVRLEEKASEVEEYANQMEQLAQERLDKLRDSERLATVGQVAGMVGHDIRNPLQAITSDLYLAGSDLALLPPSAEKTSALESLKEIEKNVDYINKIVQDLQDYSKTLKPVAKELNLDTLCQSVLEKSSVPKNIDASCIIRSEVQTIIIDPDFLKRILDNLVSNAVHAMPRGGILKISACRDAGDLVLTVDDTGVGIPEENLSKLFTPLFTTRSKGQGFGLPVIKRMTNALGGTVSVESEVGKGTKFTIRLPLQTQAR
jgi:PAS domain S-box-containing protein